MYSLSETPGTTAGPSWSLTLDDLDMDLATMDLAASVPDTPRPLPVADEPGRRRSARSALGLVLSLAVHAALIALAAVPPDAPPMVIMEISLAMGGFSGPGHATGGPGPGDSGTAEPGPGAVQATAVPIAATPQEAPAVQAESPPEPAPTPHATPIPKKTAKPAPHPRKSTPPNPARPLRPQAETTAADTAPPTSPGAETNATTPTMAAASGSSGLGVGATAGGHGRGAAGGAAGSGSGQGSGDQPFGFGDAGGPGFIHRERPTYPPLAKARKEQGTVVLMLHLDAAGNLSRVDIIDSAGPRLDEAAVKAAKASTFLPAQNSGVAMPCRAVLPIRFTLKS